MESTDYLLPKYLQIKNMIIEKIESNQFEENSKLPSEREISEKYGVSRMTARKALKMVVESGYASSHVGKGTYVRKPKLMKNLTEIEGFSFMVRRQRDGTISSRVLEARIIEADSLLSEKLKIPIGAEVYRIMRIRIVDGVPIAIQESNLPVQLFPNLLAHDFGTTSLYRTIFEEYGVKIVSSTQILDLEYADKQKAELLGIKEHDALFLFNSVSYDENNNAIEYCIHHMRGDKCSFYNELRTRSSASGSLPFRKG
jgi:GntR family transcriptional regulator